MNYFVASQNIAICNPYIVADKYFFSLFLGMPKKNKPHKMDEKAGKDNVPAKAGSQENGANEVACHVKMEVDEVENGVLAAKEKVSLGDLADMEASLKEGPHEVLLAVQFVVLLIWFCF